MTIIIIIIIIIIIKIVIGRQTYRQTDRQTDRQKDRIIDTSKSDKIIIRDVMTDIQLPLQTVREKQRLI